ncbi:GntR family transcriptional regulator [Nocardioides sp.]|uniref:GntR family transcriptional regulator n=1 Tax=Nocardioides sp. TaxID=35761 RepID=UPI0035B1F04A
MTTASGREDSSKGAASLVDTVYDAIHRNIVTGLYRPNQRLVEAAIASDLNASRTPVRTALFRLFNEGLVVKGTQGLHVREFSIDEIREIYVVRAALEGMAAALAAKNADSAAVERVGMSQRAHAAISMSEPLDKAAVVTANAEFHQAVLEASGNDRLRRLALTNNAYYFNYELAALASDTSTRHGLDEHAGIYDAIHAGDAELAERLTREHVMTGLQTIEAIA